MNLPNKLTLSRIIMIPFIMLFYLVPMFPYCKVVALALFLLASFTDMLDGKIARKYNLITNFGKFLDPIADKMLVNSSLIFFAVPWEFTPFSLTVPVFCVIVMVLRDLVVDTMRFVAASKGKVVAANIFGKLKTVFQMIALPVLMLNGWPFSLFDSSWNPYLRVASILIYLATAMSLISGIIYVVQNRNVLKEEPHD